MPNDPAARPHRSERLRVERALGAMAGTVVGFSILAIIAVLIGSAAHVDLRGEPWPTVVTVPLIGLPIGILLIIALVVVIAVRRTRGAR